MTQSKNMFTIHAVKDTKLIKFKVHKVIAVSAHLYQSETNIMEKKKTCFED
jgi:hypothetical protein